MKSLGCNLVGVYMVVICQLVVRSNDQLGQVWHHHVSQKALSQTIKLSIVQHSIITAMGFKIGDEVKWLHKENGQGFS